MRIKCIALGNRIMGDDSIAIRVLEEISSILEGENIDIVFGETDIDYALNEIEDGDFLFILDSTYFNIEPGTVTFTPIEEFNTNQGEVYSQHQPNLINLLKAYEKSVSGFIIGVEVQEIDFSLELSHILKRELSMICVEVSEFIKNTLRGI